MAKDFLSSQIRTNQIIASRSLGTLPSIMFISSSIANGTGGITGPTLGAGADVFLFVSGSRAGGATSLFGGNLKTSGSLTVNDDALVIGDFQTNGNARIGNGVLDFHQVTGTLDTLGIGRFYLGLSGSLQRTADGLSYLVAGSNITITTASNGQVTINSTAAAGPGNWNELSPAPRLNTTASVSFAGSLGSSFAAQSAGSDVFMFVSGSSNSRVALFGGDLITSGNLEVKKSNGDFSFVVTPVGVLSSSNNIFGGGNLTVSGSLTATGGLLNLSVVPTLATIEQTSVGNLEIRNKNPGGAFVSSVRTSAGNTVNFLSTTPNAAATETTISILQGVYSGAANPLTSKDTNFFVGGVRGSKDGSSKGTAVFAGDLVTSGSVYVGSGSADFLVVNASLKSDIIPDGDRTRNLGSPTKRFANVYTGDLHLRNDRGDWTILEEEDFLCVINNKSGKKFKMVLQPLD